MLCLTAVPAHCQLPFRLRLDDPESRGPLLLLAAPGHHEAGAALASAGDVNGDGTEDLLIGEPFGTGRVFLLFGARPSTLRQTLKPIHGEIVEIRTGSLDDDGFGSLVAAAGDVNDDGFDDFLLGTPLGFPGEERPGVALLLGSDRLPSVLDLSTDLVRHGLYLTTLAGEGASGFSASAVGDVNGDSIDDFAIGIRDGIGIEAPNLGVPTGKVAVVFGTPFISEPPGGLDLLSLELEALALAGAAHIIQGPAANSAFGAALSFAGDVDGDGNDDFLAGAPEAGAGGEAFILFGDGVAPLPNVAAADGDRVVRLTTQAPEWNGSRLGAAVAAGFDADRDGIPDLLLGLPEWGDDRGPSGAAFFVAGGSALRQSAVVTLPTNTTGVFRGRAAERAASAVCFVPDLDGDSAAELLLGAPGQFEGRGGAYLVYSDVHGGSDEFLSDLGASESARFLADTLGARVGTSVAGLHDTNGDGRGEPVIGAPGLKMREESGVGTVFVTFVRDEATTNAPRDLRANLLAGGRVNLTWTVTAQHQFLNVFRDDAATPLNSSPLPGHLMEFTDVDVEFGEHTYIVEADGDVERRSNSARVLVRRLPVRDLLCQQVESRDVLVSWTLADRYDALEVRVDGNPVVTLPPFATEVRLTSVPVGEHIIEVIDPLSPPPPPRASCFIEVIERVTPPIGPLTCERVGDGVSIAWPPVSDYFALVVIRSGVAIASLRPAETTFFDPDPPTGSLRYRVVGLSRDGHVGASTECTVEIAEPPPPRVRGRVRFRDRSGNVQRGRVFVLDAGGDLVGSSQVDPRGSFAIPVPSGEPVSLRFEAVVGGEVTPNLVFPGGVLVATTDLRPVGESLRVIELPLPVLLLTSRSGESDQRVDAAARWAPLTSSLESVVDRAEGNELNALVYPAVLPAGAGRGAVALDRAQRRVRAHLREQLGNAPSKSDIVAFGAAGLATRLYLSSQPDGAVARAVFLGTPHLGTARAEIELRSEFATLPLNDLPLEIDAALLEDLASRFAAAGEQTPAFLRRFNERVVDSRGAEVHLVAGNAGRDALDAILRCDDHDNRVCVSSALGGPGAQLHVVAEAHDTLGRGAESVTLVVEEILGLDTNAAETPFAPVELAAPAGVDGAGGGVGSSYELGTFFSGVLEPGLTADLILLSDTSDSIIVIFNAKLPGGVNFSLITPTGDVITPATSAGFPGVEYQTYSDGEGHQVQLYELSSASPGTYRSLLENPAENVPISYTVELYSTTDTDLSLALEPPEVDAVGTSILGATLTSGGTPLLGANVTAEIWRPNTQLEILSLNDTGADGDAIAGDGVYSGSVDAAGQAGFHLLEVTARDGVGTFNRQRSIQLEVRSEAAHFMGAVTTGANGDGGGSLDSIWVEVGVENFEAGIFAVAGGLTTLDGQEVATAHTLVEIPQPDSSQVTLSFSGERIFASQLSGPYVLAWMELFDANAQYVTAERLEDVVQTVDYSWEDFGGLGTDPFRRGDANADAGLDISDAIHVLLFLFTGEASVDCLDAADVDASIDIDISDPIFLLNYLFVGQDISPPMPLGECGASHFLGCDDYGLCADG